MEGKVGLVGGYAVEEEEEKEAEEEEEVEEEEEEEGVGSPGGAPVVKV